MSLPTAPARQGLRLEALDTLFFRDGRPLDPATRAEGGMPHPQLLAGALRSALLGQAGFDLRRFAEQRRARPDQDVGDLLRELGAPEAIVAARFRGPWLARYEGGRIEPLLPVPATLVRGKDKDSWVRLDPLSARALPGWSLQEPNRLPLWPADPRKARDAKHPGGFLTLAGIRRFLAGGVPADADWLSPGNLYDFDNRTGIGIDPQALTAAEGQIYGMRLMVLKPGIDLYAEVLSPDGQALKLPDLVPLGGQGRYVGLRPTTAIDWPEGAAAPRSLWLLATPTFPGTEGAFAPATLRAAASSSPLAVSGWDVARGGPRPTRFAVPAGSVYFVEGDFTPRNGSLCAEVEDAAQGWGFILRGAWNHD